MSLNSNLNYEMSMDDVRNYLIETGTLHEAEKLLNLQTEQNNSNSNNSNKQQNKENENNEKGIIKLNNIKDRILKEREIERDKIMRNLLTQHHLGITELQKEDEELKKLEVEFILIHFFLFILNL